MSDAVKTLTEDDHSHVCTYLGFARDAAIRADWMRRHNQYVDFHMRDLVANLKVAAELLGFELVELHPPRSHWDETIADVERAEAEQRAEASSARDFPKGFVNR